MNEWMDDDDDNDDATHSLTQPTNNTFSLSPLPHSLIHRSFQRQFPIYTSDHKYLLDDSFFFLFLAVKLCLLADILIYSQILQRYHEDHLYFARSWENWCIKSPNPILILNNPIN